MYLSKFLLLGFMISGITLFYSRTPPVFSGLDKFTKLDQFEDWVIERKFDSENNQILCRASMPQYGSWFGARVRLDENESLLIPDNLSQANLPKTYPTIKLKQSLKRCRKDLIYKPDSN